MPLIKNLPILIWPLLFCALLGLAACSGREAMPLGDTGQSFNDFRQNWNQGAEAAGLPKIPSSRSGESVLGGGNMKNTYKLAEGLALDVWWTHQGKELALSSLSLRIAGDQKSIAQYADSGTKFLIECLLLGQTPDSAAMLAQLELEKLLAAGNGQGPTVKAPGVEFMAWFKKNWGLNVSCVFKQGGS